MSSVAVRSRAVLLVRRVASESRSSIIGCRTGIPATCSVVTVFSLSVNAYVGAPPNRRSVASRQVSTVPSLRSQLGSTTRNLDHANQAQNSNVGRGRPSGPNTTGPVPQSNCSHNPGSVIHGRYCRRCSVRQASLAAATARRVVRSSPVNPSARSPLVHHIGADRAIGPIDPFLDLGQERVDDPWPLHRSVDRPTGIACGDVPAHRLGIHPRQHRRRVRTPGRVERFQNPDGWRPSVPVNGGGLLDHVGC
jgi:hypothetical protein